MSRKPYWEQDPYGPGHLPGNSGGNFRPFKDGGWSQMGHHMRNALLELARNEGIYIYSCPSEAVCENTGGVHYSYDPLDPTIWVRSTLPWPQYRWYLAVALGHHFTRVRFFNRDSQQDWRTHAEQWATIYLASAASNRVDPRYPLPSNIPEDADEPIAEKASPPPYPSQNVANVPSRNVILRRCKGFTNVLKGGIRPCAAAAIRGKGFCRHHLSQAFPKFFMDTMVGNLAKTLPSPTAPTSAEGDYYS